MAQRRWPEFRICRITKATRRHERARFRYNDGPRVLSLPESALARRIEVHQAAEIFVEDAVIPMNAYLITATLSYLLGSIPFGYLLVRIFRGEDVRASGSGNIGATNVARRSKALGIATLLLDAGKGFAAVLLAQSLFAGPHQQMLLTAAAFFV